MLNNNEYISELSLDLFPQVTSKQHHVKFCDKITDQNGANTFCTKVPGDEIPKNVQL